MILNECNGTIVQEYQCSLILFPSSRANEQPHLLSNPRFSLGDTQNRVWVELNEVQLPSTEKSSE